jgi:hypothetical protein
MNRKTEWVNCPICGDTNTRRELEPGEENYWIYYCTNLACRSNGGGYDIGYPDVPEKTTVEENLQK